MRCYRFRSLLTMGSTTGNLLNLMALFAFLELGSGVSGGYLLRDLLVPVPVVFENRPRVATPLGEIQGTHGISFSNRIYESFEGIPYARPPVGEERFEPPKAVESWEGVLQADKRAPACLQYIYLPQNLEQKILGDEDCLYLNVYAPQSKVELYPVIVYIHGGAFQFGSSAEMKPTYIMDRNVILVTLSYRVGALGFLSTEDEAVPGNMGLKDQNMAMRWVKDNIYFFGGDPERITLAGFSAGAGSVHLHYMSPLSSRLFARGMSFSGTALNCWAHVQASLERAKVLAGAVNCSSDGNTRDLVQCLKGIPGKDMMEAIENFAIWSTNPLIRFGPVVEKFGENKFLDREPLEILQSRNASDLPWLASTVSEEGLFSTAGFLESQQLLGALDKLWVTVAPSLLDFNYTIPQNEHVEVSTRIKNHYFQSQPISTETAHTFTKMVGDRLFSADSEKAARIQARVHQSPVWFYYFSYRGAQSASRYWGNTSGNFGVSHGDDISYVGDTPYLDPTTTVEDRMMQTELLDLWESYAAFGIPKSPCVWPPLNPHAKHTCYLHISGPGQCSLEYDTNFAQSIFWNSINFNRKKI